MLQQNDSRNEDIIVNVNGELVTRAAAAISPFDSAVQNGDAVWEGLRLYGGRIFRLEQHLDRLAASAAALEYEGYPSREWLIEQICRTLAANNMSDGVHIRLTVSRGIKYTSGLDPRVNNAGTTLIILAEHKSPVYDQDGLFFVTARTRRIPPQCLDQKIHSCNQLNSILAKIEANHAGADDALMLDVRGYLAETNATNVFVVSNGVVLTSTTDSCPEGVTRSAVLELCALHDIPHEVRDVSAAEIAGADEVFCTGTMGEVVGVVRIDDAHYGDGLVGPVTARIAALYSQLTASEGYRVA
ncbi:MAG: aminotransferase class IV [Gammaproteobacteria bacterium]|nr:aminotransferase class IV [Gammaproteobacteria bacterium]NNM20466.1 aminotransferase IV [Gammaproteobacteria bacterium]